MASFNKLEVILGEPFGEKEYLCTPEAFVDIIIESTLWRVARAHPKFKAVVIERGARE